MWEPPPLPRDPPPDLQRKMKSPVPQQRIYVGECYDAIYRRFNCIPTDAHLPEKLLQRYNEHYHATFAKMRLPEYEKLVNFHKLVLEALV
jgi:hypothetical protein